MIWGRTFGHDGWAPGKIIAINAQPASIVPAQKNFFRRHALVRATTYVEKHGRTSSNDLVRERLQTAGLWSALRSRQIVEPLPLSCPALLVADAHALPAGLQQARCGWSDNSVMTAQQRFNMAGIPP